LKNKETIVPPNLAVREDETLPPNLAEGFEKNVDTRDKRGKIETIS